MAAGQIGRAVLIGAVVLTLAGCGSAVSGLAIRGAATAARPTEAGNASTSGPSLGSATVSAVETAGPVPTPSQPLINSAAVSTRSTSSPTNAPSVQRRSSAPGLTPDQFVAKLVGGDPASNLLWVLPGVPSGWTVISGADAGVRAWQLPHSGCRIILQQPDGMSAGSVATSAALAADASSRLAIANRSTSARVVAATPVTFTVANVPGHVSVGFAGQQTHFTDVGVTSMVWAYLSGDYALLAENVCPDADMATWKASAGQFYRDLQVHIEF